VLELLRRGHNVWYSDADVVWRRPPAALGLAPEADLAIQIYGAGEEVPAGRFGLNMGLFWARSSVRLQAVLRKLFRAMARSFAVRGDGLDTCNDQNCLNGLLMRWQPQLVCGWHFRGTYYRRESADSEACIVLQLLDPRLALTAERAGEGGEGAAGAEVVALHMTGYAGGHTFAKVFALREWGLWRGPRPPPTPGARFLLLEADKPQSKAVLLGGMLLALLSGRALVLPRRVACPERSGGCTVESQFRADQLLLCDRALRGESGYGDVPDRLCAECTRFEGRMPSGWFVLASEYVGRPEEAVAVSHRHLAVEKTAAAVRLTDTPPPAGDHPMIAWCFRPHKNA
jgi:hypothetical protein